MANRHSRLGLYPNPRLAADWEQGGGYTYTDSQRVNQREASPHLGSVDVDAIGTDWQIVTLDVARH